MRHLAKLKVCSESHNVPKIGYFAIIIMYLIFSRITGSLSNSEEVMHIGDQIIPLSSLAGATSSFSSMLIIFLVVFYGHLGFYTATAIIVYRLFVLIYVIFVSHNFPTIPGLFTNFLLRIDTTNQKGRCRKSWTQGVNFYKERRRVVEKVQSARLQS